MRAANNSKWMQQWLRIGSRDLKRSQNFIGYSREQWRFPTNPADLLKDLSRDRKGIIYANDNLRIRPEIHPLKPGEIFNPRHHGQHYHLEIRRDPTKGWNQKNIEILKPPDYKPGAGTGYLPNEYFPGIE